MYDESSQSDPLVLTADIVASYLGNSSHVQAGDIPNIIRSVREALTESLDPTAAEQSPGAAPRMNRAQVKKSITTDALISFIDNKPYKILKRHLSRHGHDLKSYREAYGLPADYPSVAPGYSATRSALARQIGLGAQGRTGATTLKAPPVQPTAGRARKRPTAG